MHGGLTKPVCDKGEKGEESTLLIGVLLLMCVLLISSPVPALSALLSPPPLHQSTNYTQVCSGRDGGQCNEKHTQREQHTQHGHT